MARAKWDMLLSELVGGSSDPDAARLAGEIEREVQALEARERVLELGLRAIESYPLEPGDLTKNEDNISVENMPHYVAGRANAVIALMKNAASNALRRVEAK